MAIIAYNIVPPDCIERVISQRGEMTIYQRSSTLRLAPRFVLKSTWHEQPRQQQQQQGNSRSCWRLQWDTQEGEHNNVKGVAGNSSEHSVEEEDDSFQVDLRGRGASQDVIFKEKERITNANFG